MLATVLHLSTALPKPSAAALKPATQMDATLLTKLNSGGWKCARSPTLIHPQSLRVCVQESAEGLTPCCALRTHAHRGPTRLPPTLSLPRGSHPAAPSAHTPTGAPPSPSSSRRRPSRAAAGSVLLISPTRTAAVQTAAAKKWISKQNPALAPQVVARVDRRELRWTCVRPSRPPARPAAPGIATSTPRVGSGSASGQLASAAHATSALPGMRRWARAASPGASATRRTGPPSARGSPR